MAKKEEEKEDPVGALLTEEEKLAQREEEIKQQKEKIKSSVKNEQKETKRAKTEEVAMETPQDRFRKILQDNGYKVGLESITEMFFRGDTNSPEWLDYILNLGHIPAKNRELIVSTYYGKTIEELGIKIESTSVSSKNKSDKTDDKSSSKEKTDELDFSKLADDELKEMMRAEKARTALAQMAAIRAESEARVQKTQNQNQAPSSSTVMMRQVQRPVIVNGAPVTNKDGTILYETIQEPIPNSQGGGSDLTGIAAIIAAISPKNNNSSGESSEIAKAIAAMNTKIEEIQKNNEVQRKDEEIKRLNERIERKEEENKKELERKEESFKERLDRLEAERIRDLGDMKERFAEAIAHRKELDEFAGQLSSQHKKEMDEVKKRLEHAQTNIERTIVSKGTETADKVAQKVGDIAESVIKPMAEVMKDHYSTIIDQQRQQMGLPLSRDSIPKVSEDELSRFVKE